MTASATSVQAGGTVLFRIADYTNVSANSGGTIATALALSAKAPAFSTPVFTIGCDSTSGTTCTLDTVPTTNAAHVEVQVDVPKNAPAGETIQYSTTLTVKDGSSNLTATAKAPTVTVAKAAADTSSSTSPSGSTSSSASGGGGSTSSGGTAGDGATATISGLNESLGDGSSLGVGPLPAVAGVSSTIPGGTASNLFPQINPSATPSPAAGTPAGGKGTGTQPVADSSRIPLALGSSEFGAQIVGLIVLLLGVAIAVTRLSIRKARTAPSK